MKENAKNIIQKRLDDIIPYERNPRKNDRAVGFVANSIREFGFQQPIIIDEYNVIICGHVRFKAAKKLGLKEVPCIVATGLTDAEIKAYRIADNKVAEIVEWNEELLKSEMDGLPFDFSEFGFEKECGGLDEDKYVSNVPTPVYTITGECPKIEELYDDGKTKSLLDDIDKAKLGRDVKAFLKKAAQRHTVFNYSKIAEFYAHQNAEIQDLMERSALVIIDYNKAVENGFVDLMSELEDLQNAEE